MALNNIRKLTSVPGKQYGPHKNDIWVGVCQETSSEPWIWRSAIFHEINEPGFRKRIKIRLTFGGINNLDRDDDTRNPAKAIKDRKNDG